MNFLSLSVLVVWQSVSNFTLAHIYTVLLTYIRSSCWGERNESPHINVIILPVCMNLPMQGAMAYSILDFARQVVRPNKLKDNSKNVNGQINVSCLSVFIS